jgi:hypothetical protein
MPSSFEAVAVIVLALLPGALYTWAFERLVGRWGVGLADRLLRFAGVSAIFHAVASPLTFWLWSEFLRTGRASSGDPLPLQLWIAPLMYVGIPITLGTTAALGHRSGKRWAQLFTGSDPAPRAWDYLFQGHPDGWIRCRMKSGVWVAGAFADYNGRRSYVGGYPEPADMYLAVGVDVDPDTGAFLLVDGEPSLRDSGLLLKWEDVEYLEFIDA